MPRVLDYDFLAAIRWARITLEFEADGFAEFPAFSGSTIRGALGRVLRPSLCEHALPCERECRVPERCRYFSLFEQRTAAGRNIPKPMILSPPIPVELERIAYGGAVRLPYQQGPPRRGERVPRLRTDFYQRVDSGGSVRVGLTVLGQVTAVVPALIECLAREGLRPLRGRLRMKRVVDGSAEGRVLFDAHLPQLAVQAPQVQSLGDVTELLANPVNRLRVVFLTPALLNVNRRVCMDAEQVARRFASQCLVRAMQVHDAFCRHDGGRLPWMELPEMNVRLAGARLFRYVLPRLSLAQDRWMDFDGLIGHLDLEGDLTPAMPFVRAAEVLHFGQKATFGLGMVRCIVES